MKIKKKWRKYFIIALGFITELVINSISVYAYEYSSEECVNIAKVVYHEAHNQSELGKRLVIDTILNRVESDNFPNTVSGVLNQQGQYCNPSKYPPKEYYTLIAEEIYNRTNSKVLWYRTERYHKYGEPILKEGDHYFSGISN